MNNLIKTKLLILFCAALVSGSLLTACNLTATDGAGAGGNASATANQNKSTVVENKTAENKAAAKPTPEKQTSELPEFKKDEDYGKVREKMLTAGWTPHRSKDADKCGEGDERCRNRPEMQSCAGTGMANCKFVWKKGEKMLAVFTVGDHAVYSGHEFETANLAQTEQVDITGQYIHKQKIDDGRNTLDLMFEIKANNQAVYRNVQDGTETQKRNGTWVWDNAKKQLTVTMLPVPDGHQGQDVKLTFVFESAGKNLKLVSDLPYKQSAGEIYEKL